MNKVILSILSLSISAHAATVVNSAPLVKAPFDSKKPLFITGDGGFGCPDGYDLYVRALEPKPAKDSKAPPQGDFESFYYAKSANQATPAIIVTRPGIQEYTPACLQVK